MSSNRFIVITAVALALALCGCRSTQKVSSTYSYANFEPVLINNSASGVLTVQAWGNGTSKANAYHEACVNALTKVIFSGFGTADYRGQALVNEVNARERYASYFDRFFARGGEYSKFIKEASSSDKSRVESKSDGRQNYRFTFDVDRVKLKSQLQADGIIH